MRHQAEDVASRIADTGDLAQRTVEVLIGAVADDYLAALFKLIERRLIGVVAPGAVLGRDAEQLTGGAGASEGGDGLDNLQLNLAERKAAIGVR